MISIYYILEIWLTNKSMSVYSLRRYSWYCWHVSMRSHLHWSFELKPFWGSIDKMDSPVISRPKPKIIFYRVTNMWESHAYCLWDPDPVIYIYINKYEKKRKYYVPILGVQVRNMKMDFNISTLGVGSGNEH